MQYNIGDIVEGKVTGVTKFGAFVELPDKTSGMVHISEISNEYVEDINAFVKNGDTVKVKLIEINDKGKLALSMKKALPAPEKPRFKPQRQAPKPEKDIDPFEAMMNKFKATSDDKFSDLKRKNPDSKRRRSH